MAFKKILTAGFLLGFLFLFSPRLAFGQLVVTDVSVLTENVSQSFWQKALVLMQKAGSFAFQKTLSSALNKIAYDAASYIGSGGAGQSSLFNKMSLGDYLTTVGDEAAGQFIETFASNLNSDQDGKQGCWDDYSLCKDKCVSEDAAINTDCITKCDSVAAACGSKASRAGAYTPSFNICSPSSLSAKISIGLGLVDQTRPGPPNCTLSKMIKNWETDINQKMADLRDPNFLPNFASIFNPRSNDLGIFVTAYSDMSLVTSQNTQAAQGDFVTNKGWQDVRGIDGALKGVPGSAERAAIAASNARQESLGKTTGDILVDAANIFLNQLYITAFDNLLRNLATKADKATKTGTKAATYESDPKAVYGEVTLNEIISKTLQPQFNSIADYNILSQLAICIDPQNPGPDNCVIDNQFVQAISEQKTVAEALKEGYLRANWQITNDVAGDSYNSSYSLRNISILRKYRILPVGWEEAARSISGVNGQLPKKANLMDLISCFSATDSYTEFSSEFNVSDQGWCEGLIDPNWLLKAPLNYCKREGVGSNIINKDVIPGSGTGLNTIPSSLNIIRSDGYCADSQSCIKENKDGSCEAYGYCNEEKRTWKFEADACEPVYNTCQSFVSDSGQAAAYLQNTLDYGDCNVDNSGCRRYSLSGSYATSTGQAVWDGENDVYLNKNSGNCDSKDEGCTELLRVKPTWGSNLVMNADFDLDEIGASSTNSEKLNDWPLLDVERAEIVRAETDPGSSSGKAIKLKIADQHAGGVNSTNNHSLLPDNFQILSGQSYTLSAEFYAASNTLVSLIMGDENWGFVATSTGSSSWKKLSVTRPANTSYNEAIFQVLAKANGGSSAVTFYVKNIKFELGNWSNNFSSYGTYRFYQKLIPNYLEKVCYEDVSGATKDYNLKNNAPAACFKFARQCNKNEVGCELFSSKTDNFAVAAQAASEDYCAGECVGYDAYVARASHFSLPFEERMIPAKARVCSAEAAGCTEFTNLDKVGQGGEGREYYSELKHCIKPSDNPDTCQDFYTWEGQGAGYQLKVYNLAASSTSGFAKLLSGGSTCNAAIYNSPVNSPQHNSDCQEFYNTSGGVFYALLSKTITCSESCNSYRMNDKNIDKTKTTAAQCTGESDGWDSNVCYTCLNEGKWDTNNKACLYQAIPGEGKVCAAEENGCREYNGSYGNNVRLVSFYDFENGLADWTSNCASGIATSTISNNKNGHSLKYNNNAGNCGSSVTMAPRRLIEEIIAGSNQEAQLNISGQVRYGKAYTIKFMAKADANTTLNLKFKNSAGQENVLKPVTVKAGAWNLYQANLENLNHDASEGEKLIITADKDFFLDNFILSEIADRYYLIKNSSIVPDICYYDIFDKYRGADFNLGCSAYSDRSGLTHNLHRFSSLCSDLAVGCEQMISTANSSGYQEGVYNGGENKICDPGETDCVLVPRDRALYAVYDTSKLCSESNKSCSRLGEGQGGTALLGWSDVFKKNDPDQYYRTMCDLNNLGCEAWKNSDDDGYSYFKNPGFNACVYRSSQDPSISGKNWYKIPVKRCDLNGDNKISGAESNDSVCLNDGACGSKKCIIDNNDYSCSVSYLKTIGFGGAGNQIATPDKEVGLCEASASGCTEYIDMVSRFSPNIVKNPSYQSDQYATSTIPGWSSGASPEQIVALRPHRLYSLFVQGSPVSASLSKFNGTTNTVRPWLSNNYFSTSTPTIISINNANNQPLIFNSLSNSKATLKGGAKNKTIELKELIVDYRLKSQIDKKSCNGLVNFDNGCVLFNERSVVGASGLASLIGKWNAYASSDGAAPTSCNSSGNPYNCTANTLIKVRPDRTCGKWLDCVTYLQDPITNQKTCYDFGECDRLNDKNECSNFLEIATGTQEFIAQNNKNTSGYSLFGKYSLASMSEVGSLVGNGGFDFEGVPLVSCVSSLTNNPVACPKDLVVNEPAGSPVDYPAHGAAYLKVPGEYIVSPGSGAITVAQNTKYFISYLVNTQRASHQAKLEIKTLGNAPIAEFKSTASEGWEQKVVSFNSEGNSQIRLYLSTNATSTASSTPATPVYFDNINIEPVLDLGNDQYAARECRLYPTTNSLTCFNKNENVVANGFEGYCLERDPANPANCLLWYPSDKVAASRETRSALDYQGKFPLNYCTEVDANFDLVEKRKAYSPQSSGYDYPCSNAQETKIIYNPGGGNALYCDEPTRQYRWIMSQYDNGNTCYQVQWCVPINKDKEVKFTVWSDQSNPNAGGNLGASSEITEFILPVINKDGGSINKLTACVKEGFCSYLVYNSEEDNPEGWYKYNGLSKEEKEFGKIDNDINDPGIRVFDYSNSVDNENYLPLVYDHSYKSGSTALSNANKVYRLTCNQFTEVVDAAGYNYAWSNRIKSSLYSTTTPSFIPNQYRIEGYGRNRDSIPFGSASWPDTFDLVSSGAKVPLLNQYDYLEPEDVYAGRPYGCLGSSCSLIGSCSNDPSKYCLIGADSISQNTCVVPSQKGQTTGECVLLGTLPDGNNSDKILKTLFLKGNVYKYDVSQEGYVGNAGWNYYNGGNPSIAKCTNTRPSDVSGNSWCAIYPKVFNLKMYAGSSKNIVSTVSVGGLYRLEFNTKVDIEQQPLKDIVINWGDGTSQIISGQDHRPQNTHVFYHFYIKAKTTPVEVDINDKWGFFGEATWQ